MKKFLILFSCLLLTSCFEITEKITHHRDQSGEYLLTVNFSQSWLKVKSAMMLEEVDGEKIPSEAEIIQQLNDFKRKASAIEGISNVRTTTNFSDYIFTIKLDYKNIEALNKVMNSMNKQQTRVYITANTSGAFSRKTSYPIPDKLANDPKKKTDLEAAKVTSVYSFDMPVKAVENANSKISKNQKTVFLQHKVYDVLKKPSLMNNSIFLN